MRPSTARWDPFALNLGRPAMHLVELYLSTGVDMARRALSGIVAEGHAFPSGTSGQTLVAGA